MSVNLNHIPDDLDADERGDGSDDGDSYRPSWIVRLFSGTIITLVMFAIILGLLSVVVRLLNLLIRGA